MHRGGVSGKRHAVASILIAIHATDGHVCVSRCGCTNSMETNEADSPNGVRSGRRESLDSLMPIVYEHLRAIAHHQLALRPGGATLSTTGLVHEAYLKLVGQSRVAWSDRGHFFALASVAMRHVLVDRARARIAQKREGVLVRVTLDSEQVSGDEQPEVLLEINDAVDRLAEASLLKSPEAESAMLRRLPRANKAQANGMIQLLARYGTNRSTPALLATSAREPALRIAAIDSI